MQKDSLTQKLQVSNAERLFLQSCCGDASHRVSFPQDTQVRNAELETRLSDVEERLESSRREGESFRKSLRSLLELLDGKIFELTELRDSLARLLEDGSS